MAKKIWRMFSIKKILLLIFLVIAVASVSAEFISTPSDKTGSNRSDAKFAADEASMSTVDAAPALIPDYDGNDYVELNDNKPNFTDYDYEFIKGENYSYLDLLGRCGTATAMLDKSMMPQNEREGIGDIKPTGWSQGKYPGLVDSNPPYLYNRCHLIAYGLTGQNANDKNLITGTRHFNADSMLPYELEVMRYLDQSDNHVLYRVSPYFKDRELVARGVELEAYSVEDEGEGVCFHVFIYNVQPGVDIDYATGENHKE